MTRLERWSLHLAALFTGATGLIYGWLRYYGQREGEFGLEAHPLQGALQHLHVLAAPLLVFALGMLVRGHVLPMWRSGRPVGRASGFLLAMVLAPMVLSGYGVQVVVAPAGRLALAWIHGVSSLLFLAGYGVHLLAPLRQTRSALAEADASLNPS
ncbi:hypothetical protein GETHLI_15770 [Geothrix limicola]|uniref:Uncharacterized protein n=1 Tax=Geothrix limicola TaxID=2927978 RepID=A0ABQ5QDZ7_9BACT|nr:hypothetical protein [Geothrix limicola]GLH73075.1 hypothetical protein GETHLI_15770 [Geothrix limicola]